MIPASYLFKDVFRQSFYDPDIADAVERHRHDQSGRGLLARLRGRHRQSTAAPASDCAGASISTVPV